jgi:hypothetical protein
MVFTTHGPIAERRWARSSRMAGGIIPVGNCGSKAAVTAAQHMMSLRLLRAWVFRFSNGGFCLSNRFFMCKGWGPVYRFGLEKF